MTRSSAEIQSTIEGIKESIKLNEEMVISLASKIAGFEIKDVKGIAIYAKQILQWEERFNRDTAMLEEMEYQLQDAIRKESKLSVVAEVLNEIFEKDMAWWRELKETSYTELMAEVRKGNLPKSVVPLYSMSEKAIIKLFRQDIDIRFKALQKKIEDTVGEIVECKLMRSAGSTFDGWVKGTEGGARIHTIGAGGYNIIRFHYRTLITKWKHQEA